MKVILLVFVGNGCIVVVVMGADYADCIGGSCWDESEIGRVGQREVAESSGTGGGGVLI